MSWRERAAAHVVLEQPDYGRLQTLPSVVAFQLYSYPAEGRVIWFLGTRSDVERWRSDDYPFAEFAPNGDARFEKLVNTVAGPFCQAFDNLYHQEKNSEPERPFFAPSESVGELSLGLQIATLLGQPVLSIISDDDYSASLACVTAPEKIIRIRCAKAQVELLFEKGGVTSSEAEVSPQDLVKQELDTFVGIKLADPIGIIPPVEKMKLISQRRSGGPIQPASELGCPKCGARLRTPKAKQCFSCGANWRDTA